jgi:hypothetical protein
MIKSNSSSKQLDRHGASIADAVLPTERRQSGWSADQGFDVSSKTTSFGSLAFTSIVSPEVSGIEYLCGMSDFRGASGLQSEDSSNAATPT